MTARKWLAWKLVQLAARLHHTEYVEAISILSPTGRQVYIEVTGDSYGCGISSIHGLRWRPVGADEVADVDGWQFTWRAAS